jgi:hypothetical protein
LINIIICSCYDDETCIRRVKAIQDYHQFDLGWVDIGYHFLVGENGKVYEGRGWNRQSAHSPGWNNDAYGIDHHLLLKFFSFHFKVFVSLVILL